MTEIKKDSIPFGDWMKNIEADIKFLKLALAQTDSFAQDLTLESDFFDLENRVSNLVKDKKNLKERLDQGFNEIKHLLEDSNSEAESVSHYFKQNKKPYICPKCNGECSFKTAYNIVKVLCNPCEGKGIVWG